MVTHSFIYSSIQQTCQVPHIHRTLYKMPGTLRWPRSRVFPSRNSKYIRRIYDGLKDQSDMDYNRGITKRRNKWILTWRIRDGLREEVMAFKDHSQQNRNVRGLLDNTDLYHVYLLLVTVPASPDSGWSFKLKICHMKLLSNTWIAAAS